MRKICYFILVLFVSCNSSKDSIEEIVPNEEKQNEIILKSKIDKLKIITDFGIQGEELGTKLESHGYTLFSGGNVLNIFPEFTYGRYHQMGVTYDYPIETYSFSVIENKITNNSDEPFVTQEFFYENNPEAITNQPYYQVQITFKKVNDGTYEVVKEWVRDLDMVTSDFENTDDLAYVKERITQSNMIIEIGEHNANEINDVVFVRIYENRIPYYIQE